jgi:two-component system, chemotaxis family, protein-glutamate methylesterase/glutaminase
MPQIPGEQATMIKLLIVDDSALMRRLLNTVFQAEGDFTIRQARNGMEAVAINNEFRPDVVTLDINMPEMDGITALSLIMAERPVPVVMVSSLTEQGALATFEALHLGAVDYVTKPGGTISLSLEVIREKIINKVRAAVKAKVKGSTVRGLVHRLREERERPPLQPAFVRRGAGNEGLVVVGVSTGGPRTLEDILPLLPVDFPWPVLVAQHMPPSFTRTFADRMNEMCPLSVVEVAQPMTVVSGTIYIGKGGADMLLARRNGILTVLAKPENKQFMWHPSVELLGRTAVECCDPTRLVAVMLTGMGYDGADVFTEIKNLGGRTIAESEESAVVFGMPAELIKRGGATVILHAEKVAAQLSVWAKQ